MTTRLTCKKCGYKFALSDMEYLSGDYECPECGVPRTDKKKKESCNQCKHFNRYGKCNLYDKYTSWACSCMGNGFKEILK